MLVFIKKFSRKEAQGTHNFLSAIPFVNLVHFCGYLQTFKYL